MKLIRYGNPGKEQPGIIINDKMYSLPGFDGDYNADFFGNEDGMIKLQAYLAAHKDNLEELPAGIRLGPPVANPSKIVCIGLNYADHARETNAPIPAEPILFFKSTTALIGPNDDVIIPKNSKKTDWEVELAFVISKKASYVEEADALKHVAGYCLHNDYSEREFQIERNGQWVKGKSCDTFAPVGPFIATQDEIKDLTNLHMWLTVNGKTMQDGNTSTMIFDVPFLVHYISQFMTLLPGDIVTTGTPPGVGLGMKPEPVYLKPGDVVELGIDGLGSSKQVLKEWKEVYYK
jgi:2,4-diketo-3-deoxy-L-fuconate hydrolase